MKKFQIVYNLRFITDDILSENPNMRNLSLINSKAHAGYNVIIMTPFNEQETGRYLEMWGCLYDKIATESKDKALGIK